MSVVTQQSLSLRRNNSRFNHWDQWQSGEERKDWESMEIHRICYNMENLMKCFSLLRVCDTSVIRVSIVTIF